MPNNEDPTINLVSIFFTSGIEKDWANNGFLLFLVKKKNGFLVFHSLIKWSLIRPKWVMGVDAVWKMLETKLMKKRMTWNWKGFFYVGNFFVKRLLTIIKLKKKTVVIQGYFHLTKFLSLNLEILRQQKRWNVNMIEQKVCSSTIESFIYSKKWQKQFLASFFKY